MVHARGLSENIMNYSIPTAALKQTAHMATPSNPKKGKLGTNTVQKLEGDLLTALPKDVSYLVLAYLKLNDLLVTAFVSIKWNKLVGDKRAWKGRESSFPTYYRFAQIDDTILELGNLLAPGKIFDPAEHRFHTSYSFNPLNDNPFINNQFTTSCVSENYKEIAVTLAIKIAKKYNDYTAIDTYSWTPDMLGRIARRNLPADFRLDFLQQYIVDNVNGKRFEKAYTLFKRIHERNYSSFYFDRALYFKMDKDCFKEFIIWMITTKKEREAVMVQKICKDLGRHNWNIEDWITEYS